jgi:hypothetical protein
MKPQKIYEQFDGAFAEISINSEKMIISNVALVGQISRNGRRYTIEALKGGVSKYEGVKVYIDHPSSEDEKRGWRSTRDLAGKVENARFDGHKIRGDVHLLSTDGGKLAYEIATSVPDIAGMSHNAFGNYHKEDGVEVVESIEKVVSVDVVTEPATNNGFFEAENNKGVTKMDYKEVTMVGLKEARKDLVDTLMNEGKESRDGEFQKVIKENEDLKTEKADLQKKVDEMKVKETLAKKEILIDKMLKESELPEEAKTEIFKKSLMGINAKEGEKLEEKIKEQIDDRLDAISGKTGVKDNTERKGKTETKATPESIAAELKGPGLE